LLVDAEERRLGHIHRAFRRTRSLILHRATLIQARDQLASLCYHMGIKLGNIS
jgi:hypothetical protein